MSYRMGARMSLSSKKNPCVSRLLYFCILCFLSFGHDRCIVNEIDLFVHVCWKSTFSKKSFSLPTGDLLNVLRCVTHGFMISVVFGCAQ